jgi:hypothetical protein
LTAGPSRSGASPGSPPQIEKSLRVQLLAGLLFIGIGVAIGLFATITTLACSRRSKAVDCAIDTRLWGVLLLRHVVIQSVRTAELETVEPAALGEKPTHWLTLHGANRSYSPHGLSNRIGTEQDTDVLQDFLASDRPALTIREPASLLPTTGDRVFLWISVLSALFGLTYALPLIPSVRRYHGRKYNTFYRW